MIAISFSFVLANCIIFILSASSLTIILCCCRKAVSLNYYHLQAGKLIQLSSAFFGGFIIAFTKGWLLTLVMLTSLPLIAIAGVVSAQFLTNISSKKLTSYGDAGDTVEQTIGAIRTVSSNYINFFSNTKENCTSIY
jgi:ABC-type multidrug transport system fused ATPase/permease subunit